MSDFCRHFRHIVLPLEKEAIYLFNNMRLITDKYGRTFKTLRVSLLSRCNLGCVYCTLGEDENTPPAKETQANGKLLTTAELLSIIGQLQEVLQLETIRLTGGEPLLYPDLVPLIKGIREIGIHDIRITTNGFLLERLAVALKDAGLQSVNVSLDAMDEAVFFLVSRRAHLERVLQGIEAAVGAGLAVKINAVVMKGINESQILPLLAFAFARDIPIRFLEVMAMGHLYHQADRYFFSQTEILGAIATRYRFSPLKRKEGATANYWMTEEGYVFGIIANESAPFCSDCNRLRLDSHGNIFGCLSSNHPVSLAGVTGKDELLYKLWEALQQKQPVKFKGSELSMLYIGG